MSGEETLSNVISFMSVKKEVGYRKRQLNRAIEKGESEDSISNKKLILKKAEETLQSYVGRRT